jgi:hypothetical protein
MMIAHAFAHEFTYESAFVELEAPTIESHSRFTFALTW